MPCHIPGSRASNLRLQRKSLDLPELGLVRFALRNESTRSRTAPLGKGVAKDCSFAISKINVGDRDDKPEQNRVAGKELGVASINSEALTHSLPLIRPLGLTHLCRSQYLNVSLCRMLDSSEHGHCVRGTDRRSVSEKDRSG